MIEYIRNKRDGRIIEPPRGATGYAITGSRYQLHGVPVVDNKSEKPDMSNQTTIELSSRAKENLQKNAELRKRDSKFIKMQAGEKRTFQFDPEKIEQVETEFNGKKTIRFRYTVIEEGADREQYFEVSKRTSEDIDTFLTEGVTRLKIQRSGSGTDRILV